MIHELPFTSLLNDLTDWADDFDKKIFQAKVRRVYYKCIRKGKNEIAKRIKEKYKITPIQDDLTMAFKIALAASKLIP